MFTVMLRHLEFNAHICINLIKVYNIQMIIFTKSFIKRFHLMQIITLNDNGITDKYYSTSPTRLEI